MITKENFQPLIESMRPSEIRHEIDKAHDWILMESHIFNTGGYATVESMDWNEETEKHSSDNGFLFCDKDTFLELLEF